MKIRFFSFLYRVSRYIITRIIFFTQKILFFQKDLETAVNIGDRALGSFHIFKDIIYKFPLPKNSSVDIYNLKFPSPLIGASFKANQKIMDMWLKMGIGSVIFKTIMKDSSIGNPRPRLQEIDTIEGTGLINSLGLPGPGIDKFLNDIVESKLWKYNRPIGISIGGETVNDYLNNINLLEAALANIDQSYFYECNISCPNTDNGQTICEDPQSLEILLKHIRENNISKIISIKVSPDVSNHILYSLGEICSAYDSIIINAGNTQYKTINEIGLSRYQFSMKGGGLSGPAIFSRTKEMVKLFSNFKMPIMATGGISSINEINILKDSGASLFGMATSLVLDPYIIAKINKSL